MCVGCIHPHSRPQRSRSFSSAPRIATSGRVQQRKSAIHGLPVTLRMLWVKSDKSDWFWSQSIVFTNPFKTGMSLDLTRGRDSWCWPKGARPLETRMPAVVFTLATPHSLFWCSVDNVAVYCKVFSPFLICVSITERRAFFSTRNSALHCPGSIVSKSNSS